MVVEVDTVVTDGFLGIDPTAFPLCFLFFTRIAVQLLHLLLLLEEGIRQTFFEIHSKLCISTSSYCDIYDIFFRIACSHIDSNLLGPKILRRSKRRQMRNRCCCENRYSLLSSTTGPIPELPFLSKVVR